MAKQCSHVPLGPSMAALSEVRALAKALYFLRAASVTSSPLFPAATCKGVGGKVLTASFISDLNAQEKRQGLKGVSLNCLSKKTEGKEKKKSSHAELAIGKMTAEIILFLKFFFMIEEKTVSLSPGTSVGALDFHEGSDATGTHHL